MRRASRSDAANPSFSVNFKLEFLAASLRDARRC